MQNLVYSMAFSNNYRTLALCWSQLCMLMKRELSINFGFNISDYGVDKYDIGTGFGHFGIAVDDVSIPSFSILYCPFLTPL